MSVSNMRMKKLEREFEKMKPDENFNWTPYYDLFSLDYTECGKTIDELYQELVSWFDNMKEKRPGFNPAYPSYETFSHEMEIRK